MKKAYVIIILSSILLVPIISMSQNPYLDELEYVVEVGDKRTYIHSKLTTPTGSDTYEQLFTNNKSEEEIVTIKQGLEFSITVCKIAFGVPYEQITIEEYDFVSKCVSTSNIIKIHSDPENKTYYEELIAQDPAKYSLDGVFFKIKSTTENSISEYQYNLTEGWISRSYRKDTYENGSILEIETKDITFSEASVNFGGEVLIFAIIVLAIKKSRSID